MRLALCLGLALLAQASAAASLVDLLLQTPPPPSDGPTAAAWVRDGAVIAPGFLAFEARLRQERVAGAAAVTSLGDAASVLAAVRGYTAYRAQNSGVRDPQRVLDARSAWLIRRFDGIRPSPEVTMLADHNLLDDELKAWNGLFASWQSARRGVVARGEAELAAAGDPATIRDAGQAAALSAYRLALLREIDLQLSITRNAVTRAAALSAATQP